MIDLYGRTIVPGDWFLRIENRMGGSALRFYFYGGEAADSKIHVQELGGTPRTINKPHDTLIYVTNEQIRTQREFESHPTIDSVVNPPQKKPTRRSSARVIGPGGIEQV